MALCAVFERACAPRRKGAPRGGHGAVELRAARGRALREHLARRGIDDVEPLAPPVSSRRRSSSAKSVRSSVFSAACACAIGINPRAENTGYSSVRQLSRRRRRPIRYQTVSTPIPTHENAPDDPDLQGSRSRTPARRNSRLRRVRATLIVTSSAPVTGIRTRRIAATRRRMRRCRASRSCRPAWPRARGARERELPRQRQHRHRRCHRAERRQISRCRELRRFVHRQRFREACTSRVSAACASTS